MTLLLLFSLLLHIVAFYFIVVLFTKYATIKNISDTQAKILEEAENSLTSFLIEMKDENERLIQDLTNSSLPTEMKKTTQKMKPLENRNEGQEKITVTEDISELPDHLIGLDEVKDVVEINNQQEKKENIPFEVEAINLFEEGYTVEQIAKKLNKGKTEIELLIKFRQND